MSPRGLRVVALSAAAPAGAASCAAPPSGDGRVALSRGAERLLIPDKDLGPQAQKLLSNLRADPYVYLRFINRPWARATCAALDTGGARQALRRIVRRSEPPASLPEPASGGTWRAPVASAGRGIAGRQRSGVFSTACTSE